MVGLITPELAGKAFEELTHIKVNKAYENEHEDIVLELSAKRKLTITSGEGIMMFSTVLQLESLEKKVAKEK